MEKIIAMVMPMVEGSGITLQIFFITLALSLPLGLLVALARISGIRPLRFAMEVYIWLMRGTPLMLQLLFVYFALPMVGILLPDLAAALLAFTLKLPFWNFFSCLYTKMSSSLTLRLFIIVSLKTSLS